MQNYGHAPQYARPGSTTSFAGQSSAPPPPPGYGAPAPQGYPSTSTAAGAQSRWAAPTPTPTSTSNSWNQPPPPPLQQQQAMGGGGYDQGTYGAMAHQAPMQQTYPDQPPPPPPKPYGFAAAVQQQQQQQQHGTQSWPAPPQQHAGYQQNSQHGGYPAHALQQTYSNAAPPPPSATPGGSYFPPPQGERPGSMYGASPASSHMGTPQQPLPVVSPNEQQPAYISPSLTGQGVQAYMPSNTNPAPGVYVPPPPDLPAWQQAQHAPLQGGSKKFKYTKPTVDPSFYAQGYQGIQPMHAPPLPPRQFDQPHTPAQHSIAQPIQHQYAPQQQPHQQQTPVNQYQYQPPQPAHYGQPLPPPQSYQQSHEQPGPAQGQYHQQHVQQPAYHQQPQPQPQPQPNYQPSDQWQSTPGAAQNIGQQAYQAPQGYQQPAQQQGWEPGHQSQPSVSATQYSQGSGQDIQAPKPLARTDTAASDFFHEPSPQSQPVSPISHRQSTSFTPGHPSGSGHTGSVSSMTLANLHAQRTDNRTSSPKIVAPPNLPTPPPPRDDKSKFSALGSGGPSDWERFGAEEEIDDEELFTTKKEDKQTEANTSHSVELPAHVPSPPLTQGWPSPAQPAPLNTAGRRITYAPTPPPVTASPVHSNRDQGLQQLDAASTRNTTSIMAPHESTCTVPPQSTQQSYVMDNGGWTGQPNQTPSQTQKLEEYNQQPPPVPTSFVRDDTGWESSQQTPTQEGLPHIPHNYTEELKVKEDAYEHLRIESANAQASLRAEIDNLKRELERLRLDSEQATKQAESERNALTGKIQTINHAAEQAATMSAAQAMEKDLTLERMKEDIEGKEHNIEERDTIVADLRRQLEQEKSKEPPKPTHADLIPDLDPWYAASLERYITMLRAEANEFRIEGKVEVFRAFMKAESQIRGIEYFETSPTVPAVAPSASQQAQEQTSVGQSSSRKQALIVDVPKDVPSEDDYDYSPGGRPVLKRQATVPAAEHVPPQQHPNTSAPSTTILTPTSSVGEDTNKTPVQSLPEEVPQPQYKAYVPPAVSTNDPKPLSHRPTMSFSSIPAAASPSAPSQSHDEIFFGAPGLNTAKPTSRPTSRDSASPEVSVPAPLSFTPSRPTLTAPPPNRSSIDALAQLIPRSLEPRGESTAIKDLRTSFTGLKPHVASMEELVKTWEKSASLARRKKDDARRKREEENEEHNDDLFESNEISYAEMNQREDEFKQKENELKAQEDRDEYKSYVESVFDPVYDGLQADLKDLMDMYVDIESQLATAVSGIKSLGENDVPSTLECLELLKEVHEQMEGKHEKVVQAVAERDRRYKKTETQPLYAAGNIAKMKSVEKHFENAEKQAVLRAKREEAERIGELVHLVEEVVVDAVGVEQREIDTIIAAIKEMEDGKGDAGLLDRAQHTLTALKTSSKSFLRLFNNLEIQLNSSVLDAEMAKAQAENADATRVAELEKEKAAGAKKMMDEYERRVTVLSQDENEVQRVIRQKSGKGELREEGEKEERLKTALEEAKRRNGQVS
ncbi:hypothetical protein ACN47E_001186 [Coniothyrium glycines]